MLLYNFIWQVTINKNNFRGYMNRTINYIIKSDVAGLSVGNYLRKKGFSYQNLVDLKKQSDSILLNGEPTFQNRVLDSEDILVVHVREDEISKNIVPVELPLDIVYEDEDLLVINKSPRVPIHPSINHFENTMANALAWYFGEKSVPFVFRCINRLDKDTSGLTIVAKHKVSAGILGQMMKAKNDATVEKYLGKGIEREYLAIVRGNVVPEVGMISAPIGRKENSIMERMVDEENGESAITHYRVLKVQNGHSLVSLKLETGRTHQIRVHMKHIGFPLVGDYLYNPDMEYIQRQALHSYRLHFFHPITGEEMEFTAPLPEDMQRVLVSM